MVRTVALVFCALVALASVGTAQELRPEVILIRGGAGYWPGVSRLSRDLTEHGFAPRAIVGAAYALHVPRIAENYRSGNIGGPVTIVGYSSGADYACALCASLQKRGVPVATVVLMESTLGTPVPANVEFCVNIYESRPSTDWIPAFRGVPVEAVSPQTQLMNLDSNSESELNWLTDYNHFTVASHTDTHVMLRNLLLQRQKQFILEHTAAASVPSAPVTVPPPATTQSRTLETSRVRPASESTLRVR
jgi:hypothetical protein